MQFSFDYDDVLLAWLSLSSLVCIQWRHGHCFKNAPKLWDIIIYKYIYNYAKTLHTCILLDYYFLSRTILFTCPFIPGVLSLLEGYVLTIVQTLGTCSKIKTFNKIMKFWYYNNWYNTAHTMKGHSCERAYPSPLTEDWTG